ncbi:MAG TPA: septum formation initiator [Sphingomonadaceae bacterium]|jgi:cell division protein FtsB|nr:septum formation initiator [Sphingomonadaceae bacterium]
MARSQPTHAMIRSAAGPAVALLVVAMFAGYALFGTNGLLQLGDYKRQIRIKQVELAKIDAERARLLNRKRLIEKGDPDIADEMVRSATDMIGNDQYVLITR